MGEWVDEDTGEVFGELEAEVFQRHMAACKAERNRYLDGLQAAQKAIDGGYLLTAHRILELGKNARILWESRSPEERRDLIAELVLEPQLAGDTVRYSLKKPYAVLADLRDMEEWRARLDSNQLPSA